VSEADQFRRELLALSGVLGAACEDLAVAILKHVPPGARTPAQAEAMSAADKLRTFARILDNLDEGAASFAGVE
jgi:hypothetical protein